MEARQSKPPDGRPAYPMTGADPGSGADGALVRAVAEGSHDALAVLYDRYVDAIFAVARRLTSDRGVAEEVVQETFLALWDRAETFDPTMGSVAAGCTRSPATGASTGYVRPLGVRISYRCRRRDGGRRAASEEADAGSLDRVATAGCSWPGRRRRRRRRGSWPAETRRAVQAALATMPADEREVIVLAYATN